MTSPVLIVRPIDGAKKTAARARKLGLEPVVDPLFRIASLDWRAPPASAFDALMLTSVNAAKAAGPTLTQYLQLPVLAVGPATAAAARKMGFLVREVGSGGAQSLLNSFKTGQYRRILRLAGRHHIPLTAPEHQIELREVYESERLPLGSQARQCLEVRNLTLLHSVRAAEILTEEMEKAEIVRSNTHIAALSQNIADAAGNGWRGINVAEQPNDDALLSLAVRLCSAATENNAETPGDGFAEEPE